MARETALWTRLKAGAVEVRATGRAIDIQRLENSVGSGHPDVEGVMGGGDQFWIELKSELRPKNPTTPIRFKVRQSQAIWHRRRAALGFRAAWVLCQVGEGHGASLYLIPGSYYGSIVAPESILHRLSACPPTATPADVLMRAADGW
jgi:hypothetical protein